MQLPESAVKRCGFFVGCASSLQLHHDALNVEANERHQASLRSAADTIDKKERHHQ